MCKYLSATSYKKTKKSLKKQSKTNKKKGLKKAYQDLKVSRSFRKREKQKAGTRAQMTRLVEYRKNIIKHGKIKMLHK